MRRPIFAASDHLIPPFFLSPVFDMIEHRLRTLAGWPIAISCAIIPPIETPATWAEVIPSESSNAAASAAMSST